MMDRQMIIGILGQMPTEQLLKALAVVAPGGGGDENALAGLAVGGGADNKIQSWGDRTIKYSGGKDRPGISDKNWADGGEMNAESGRQGQMDDGVDPTNIFLQTGGGV